MTGINNNTRYTNTRHLSVDQYWFEHCWSVNILGIRYRGKVWFRQITNKRLNKSICERKVNISVILKIIVVYHISLNYCLYWKWTTDWINILSMWWDNTIFLELNLTPIIDIESKKLPPSLPVPLFYQKIIHGKHIKKKYLNILLIYSIFFVRECFLGWRHEEERSF